STTYGSSNRSREETQNRAIADVEGEVCGITKRTTSTEASMADPSNLYGDHGSAPFGAGLRPGSSTLDWQAHYRCGRSGPNVEAARFLETLGAGRDGDPHRPAGRGTGTHFGAGGEPPGRYVFQLHQLATDGTRRHPRPLPF